MKDSKQIELRRLSAPYQVDSECLTGALIPPLNDLALAYQGELAEAILDFVRPEDWYSACEVSFGSNRRLGHLLCVRLTPAIITTRSAGFGIAA